ncbi:MAG: hypothetical protein LBD91_01175 [Prevotellaceae bacterium]|jgi:hypothetical protein|nr:hypothetical protein [Prevotellaceae bacterium]
MINKLILGDNFKILKPIDSETVAQNPTVGIFVSELSRDANGTREITFTASGQSIATIKLKINGAVETLPA